MMQNCYIILHGQVVEFPPIRAENVLNDIAITGEHKKEHIDKIPRIFIY